MLNTMNSWLNQEKAIHKSPELKLSITKIMVGMMMADEHLNEFEYNEIVAFLTEHFDLSSEESKAIIEQVQSDESDEVAFDKAAKQIIDVFSVEERAYILSIVWRIALVDGEVYFVEEQYLNRLSGLFEVSATRLSELKKEQESNFPNLDQRERYQEF